MSQHRGLLLAHGLDAFLCIDSRVRKDVELIRCGELNPIEVASASNGVGSSIGELQPVAVAELRELVVLVDNVSAVTGGTPKCGRESDSLLSSSGVGEERGPQDTVGGVLSIVEDAVERAVEAISEPVVLVLDGPIVVEAVPLTVNRGHERGSSLGEITPRLGNDTDSALCREALCHGRVDGVGNVAKHDVAVVVKVTSEATSNVEQLHLEPNVLSLVKDHPGGLNGGGEGSEVLAGAANVERDSDDVEVESLGSREELLALRDLSTVLKAQGDASIGVVSTDAEDALEPGVEGGDLVELALSVKGGVLDSVLLGKANVRGTLGGVGKDDAAGIHSHLEHHLELSLRGAVKASTHGIEELEDTRLGVALDSVKGGDAGHCSTPGL